MAQIAGIRERVWTWLAAHGAELRLCVRTTAGAVITFLLADALHLSQGYWAVLTAVIIMQASVGGSVKATIDRMVGTLSGAVYGAAVAFLIPRTTELELVAALVVALVPLALLSALNPGYRVAPITAIIVLLSPSSQDIGPIEYAVDRTIEIALGSIVGLGTALAILPARAHRLVREEAAHFLALHTTLLALHLGALTAPADEARIRELQREIRLALAELEKVVREARHERNSRLTNAFDPDPLLRTLSRLRNDVVMIGRAAAEPFPDAIAQRLGAVLAQVAEAVTAFLRDAGTALAERRASTSLETVAHALDTYAEEIAALRHDGILRALPGDAVGRVFAFGFALDQLRNDLQDLESRTSDCAQPDRSA